MVNQKISIALENFVILRNLRKNEQSTIINKLFENTEANLAFHYKKETIVSVIEETNEYYKVAPIRISVSFLGINFSIKEPYNISKELESIHMLNNELIEKLMYSYEKELAIEKEIANFLNNKQKEIDELIISRKQPDLIDLSNETTDELLDAYNIAKRNNDIEKLKIIEDKLMRKKSKK